MTNSVVTMLVVRALALLLFLPVERVLPNEFEDEEHQQEDDGDNRKIGIFQINIFVQIAFQMNEREH
ncbi:hypothetical protein FHS18_000929 [Paenibacillus phyllosphaerae]|uniref:Uncharacterized protein n=1 Tax=Paenibacillus phyllosphaerae TaxID=274593 RepID=A0A7W5AUE9_9BACL|nr:hypothetical protein [Paenibacillus phyllosphaerae]MBB3108877.1 hypothetical protein [Paenibacillus phyllosphaerae]